MNNGPRPSPADKPAHVKVLELDPGLSGKAVLQRAGRACLDHLLRNEESALSGDIEGIHQMRVAERSEYGEKGQGFALGFAPKMFELVDGVGLAPTEITFVGPVLYDRRAIFERHRCAIEAAASIFLAATDAHADLMADGKVGWPFMCRMANEIIASPLIWNCITSKHTDYEIEREVRLILMGQTSNLAPYIETRMRGGETVPYVAHPFRIRAPGAIHEVVVGPAAAADAEDRVRDMLASHGLASVPVTRSKADRAASIRPRGFASAIRAY